VSEVGAFRLLLALSVLLSHSGGPFWLQLAGGAFAVLIFFMVSGFLMQLVLTTRYDPTRDLMLFYGNRLLRIFPLYWMTLVTSLLLSAWLYRYGTGYFFFLASYIHALTAGDVVGILVTQIAIVGGDVLLFLNITPHGLGLAIGQANPPAMLLMVNPPSWSLGIELLFYALAPFLARKRAIWTVALLIAAGAARVLLIGYTHTLTGLTADRFFPTALPFFLAGMLACRCRQLITKRHSFAIVAGAVTMIFLAAIGPLSVIGQSAGIPAQLFGYGFAITSFWGIPALFSFSNSPHVRTWVKRWDAQFGALSYPVYLLHWQIITALDTFLPTAPIRPALVVAITIAFAMALTRFVEDPIDRYRERRRVRTQVAAKILV
jgi:peptidoglycan/LPS O-acetylase OafA/YrhL